MLIHSVHIAIDGMVCIFSDIEFAAVVHAEFWLGLWSLNIHRLNPIAIVLQRPDEESDTLAFWSDAANLSRARNNIDNLYVHVTKLLHAQMFSRSSRRHK